VRHSKKITFQLEERKSLFKTNRLLLRLCPSSSLSFCLLRSTYLCLCHALSTFAYVAILIAISVGLLLYLSHLRFVSMHYYTSDVLTRFYPSQSLLASPCSLSSTSSSISILSIEIRLFQSMLVSPSPLFNY